jgi:hypothetical protein
VGSLKKEVIIVVIVLIILFFFIVTMEPSEPKEFVNDKVILNYTNLLFNYKIIRYPTSAEIVPFTEKNINIGFVTDPWNLKFGNTPGNGSYITRYIAITNLKEKYNKIKLKAYGNITPLVNFSKNNFVLNENESVAIEVNFNTDSAALGNYTGEIDIIIKVPKYDFLKTLM